MGYKMGFAFIPHKMGRCEDLYAETAMVKFNILNIK